MMGTNTASSRHDPGHDPGHDAGHGAGHDPGHDAGHGAGHDPGHDPGHDAGHDPGHDAGRGAGLAVGLLLTTASLLAATPAMAQSCIGMPAPGRATVAAQVAHAGGVDNGSSITDVAARVAGRVVDMGPAYLTLHGGLAVGRHGPSDARDGLIRLDGGALVAGEPFPRLQLCGGAVLTHGMYDIGGNDLTHTTIAAAAGGAIAFDVGTAVLTPYGIANAGRATRDFAGSSNSGRDLSLELGTTLTVDRYLVGTGVLLRHAEFRGQPRFMVRFGLIL